jgi:FtsX-like permease family/MacB-like periplasmic core domain
LPIILTWLRLDVRRRWRSLLVLALLVALATATVLTAIAGARRGDTAFDRLWAQTLPATATVLPNQPGFDWAKIRGLPEVEALSLFPVSFGFAVEGYQDVSPEWVPADRQLTRTIERPVIVRGRLLNPSRIDEVDITPEFAGSHGKEPGDMLTLHLATPRQINAGFDGSGGKAPRGPQIRVRIVGVIRSPWESVDISSPGGDGGVLASPALFVSYRANIMGTNGRGYINAEVRLRGGAAALPAFRADLARATGRRDIDVWNNMEFFGDPVRRATGYEAAWLLAFGLAALVAAFFLIGQSLVRYVFATAADLQVLQAVGLTRWQAVASAVVGPCLAAAAGATLGVAGAIVASRWMPIALASTVEPHPGVEADWLVLAAGWVLASLLALAGSTVAAGSALAAGRRHSVPRRSTVAAIAASAGLPVPMVIGTRFALEPGRGSSAMPVRPALLGAITGVLGVLAVFTFSAGIADAAANPARFGQTWQLDAFLGQNGQEFGPSGQVLAAVAADRDVIGVDDARIGGAQSGQVSVESFTYDPIGGKRPAVVLTSGRMPAASNEIALAPLTARELHAVQGSSIRLAGGGRQLTLRVTGIGFVPAGPHNDYSEGAWLTPAGYDRLFAGAVFSFKFHAATVALRPGANVQTVARRLDAVAARFKGGQVLRFTAPAPLTEIQELEDLQVLPLALSAFLSLLAIGAVGHALSAAVRRRRHDLAVLRTLGMTRRQVRMVIATQASVLALIGLVFGIPMGLVVGRDIWRVVAGFTPLAYHPPLALLALLIISPVALLVANAQAAWPQRTAARLNVGQILRSE